MSILPFNSLTPNLQDNELLRAVALKLIFSNTPHQLASTLNNKELQILLNNQRSLKGISIYEQTCKAALQLQLEEAINNEL